MRISDWSSDVCSSDLSVRWSGDSTAGQERHRVHCHALAAHLEVQVRPGAVALTAHRADGCSGLEGRPRGHVDARHVGIEGRSAERRVGKECVSTCRSRWSPYLSKKKYAYHTLL